MALVRARPGERIDLSSIRSGNPSSGTEALVKTDQFEAIRLVVPAGKEIPLHEVSGDITLHCIGGAARIGGAFETELRGGEWTYLPGGSPHSVLALEDSALLLTIMLAPPRSDGGR